MYFKGSSLPSNLSFHTFGLCNIKEVISPCVPLYLQSGGNGPERQVVCEDQIS